MYIHKITGVAIRIFAFIFFVQMGISSAHARSTLLESDFKNPPNQFRPLQIVHGFDGITSAKIPNQSLDQVYLSELIQAFKSSKIQNVPDLHEKVKEALQDLQARGLGGVVCNVSFRDYMKDENQWELFSIALSVCRELNFRVWIYDEDGYPSGAAGGLVLEKDKAFEAQELILDPTSSQGFRVRPSYEGTHASNNYYMSRRYPNLLDQRAVDTFTQVTHDAYAQICGSGFGTMIEAFFTDEPSMLACNLGQLAEEVRKNVRVLDPLDPSVVRQPAVPWVDDLPALFQEKYHQDLLQNISSLFAGFSDTDKTIRREFWALISSLLENRYFGTLQKWCEGHHLAASGHTLWEEEFYYHTPLNGNILRNLQRMDIPGIDILSSNPGNVFGGYGFAASLASSAANLNGTRRVMTETSDFSERMAKHPVSLEEMCATASWQFALGVTDFMLYYPSNLPVETYKPYNDYVGRLGTLLTPAKRTVNIAVYYPVSDLWAWYIPEAERMNSSKQPQPLQTIVNSLKDTCEELVRHGDSFCLVDHNHLAASQTGQQTLKIGASTIDTLIVPQTDVIPSAAQDKIQEFQKAGGRVLYPAQDAEWLSHLPGNRSAKVESDQEGCLWAEYTRDAKTVGLLVNTKNTPWSGTVQWKDKGPLTCWHFDDGRIEPVSENPDKPGFVQVTLQPFESIALVQNTK